MDNNKYNNGFKTVAIFLQMVFLIVVIVICTLLSNLFERSMPGFDDIGNDSFFHSTYYTGIVVQQTKELTTYLQLQKMQASLFEEEMPSGKIDETPSGYTSMPYGKTDETPSGYTSMPYGKTDDMRGEKYKQYKLEFDDGSSNFYYWYFQGNECYTNVEQEYTKEEAVRQAKKWGSYLYYDDVAISFQGNISHLDRDLNYGILRLFSCGGTGGALIVAVDESLPKEDIFSEAKHVYETYFPWVELGVFVAILASMGFVLCMIYITLATGRNGDDSSIRLYRIDYLPAELQFLVFIVLVTGLVAFRAKLGSQTFGISSMLILTGTLVFLSDAVLLTLYMSVVRKIKADIFISCSLASRAMRILKKSMNKRYMGNRIILQFMICGSAELFLTREFFAKGNAWAMVGILIIFVYLLFYFLQQTAQRKKLIEGILEIGSGNLDYKFDLVEFSGDYRELADKINGIGQGLSNAVEENLKNERLKTELITNVSHDIKTPLTSIINYIDLIKMEGTRNEKLENYVEILEKKSQRLKQLTEDLVEISRISSGNITLDMQPINMVELICQTGGEFNEIFEDMGLTIITRLPQEPVMILADGNRIWRIVQNLYNNVAKYALKDTRVYVELKENDGNAEFSIKDISAHQIHKMPQDLSERFVRGDESRGTEGSGLGLSIARNLAYMMGGTFDIQLDGDLFTASITFPVINP